MGARLQTPSSDVVDMNAIGRGVYHEISIPEHTHNSRDHELRGQRLTDSGTWTCLVQTRFLVLVGINRPPLRVIRVELGRVRLIMSAVEEI